MGEVTSYTKTKIDEIEAASIISANIINDELILTRGNLTTINLTLPSVGGGITQTDLDNAISALISSSPDTLNTLNELAAALGNDPSFSVTIINALSGKLSQEQADLLYADITHQHSGFEGQYLSGVQVRRLSNYSIANNTPFPFDHAIVDPDGWWDIATPTKLIVPGGKAGWYWVGANITTLGTSYGGGSNLNVQIHIAKNWNGNETTLLNATVVYERFNNSTGGWAHGNSTLGLIYLDEGDELEIAFIGTEPLLVESNPSDGLPSGYLNDEGPGTLSPHFYAILAESPPGPTGPSGPDGDMTWNGVWDLNTSYLINQVVQHQGSSYVAINNNTNSQPPSVNWELVASKGDQGDDGSITSLAGFYLASWAKAVRVSGNISLNQTNITEIDSALRLTLTNAAEGDLVVFGVSGRVSNVAQYVGFDVYTIVDNVITNPFGSGLSNGLASLTGIQAWSQTNVAQEETLAGSYPYELVADDINNGDVIISLFYAKINTTSRTLYAVANNPFAVYAYLYKPF